MRQNDNAQVILIHSNRPFKFIICKDQMAKILINIQIMIKLINIRCQLSMGRIYQFHQLFSKKLIIKSTWAYKDFWKI